MTGAAAPRVPHVTPDARAGRRGQDIAPAAGTTPPTATRNPHARIRRLGTATAPRKLVCFAHAGAARSVFQPWASELAGHYEVFAAPVHAGQGGPRGPDNWPGLIEQTVAELRGLDGPLAVHGHSMGSLLAYETTRRLTQCGHEITHLVVSGHNAPRHAAPCEERPTEPRALLAWSSERYGGVAPEILEDVATARLMGERLHADLRLHDRYHWLAGPEPNVELHAVHATGDHATSAPYVADWTTHTTGPSAMHTLPGGHFAPLTHLPALLRDLAEEHHR